MRRVKGFTLIEMMVVVIIVAILAAAATPLFTNYVAESRMAEVYAVVAAIESASEIHHMRNNRYAMVRWDGDFIGILGVRVPVIAGESDFRYAVYGIASGNAYVGVLTSAGDADGTVWLCRKYMQGDEAGRWWVNPAHDWGRHLQVRPITTNHPG